MDLNQIPFYLELKAILEDLKFLPNGGMLAIGFSHAYPMERMSRNNFSHLLKGEDALVHQIVKVLGFRFSLRRTRLGVTTYGMALTSFDTKYYEDQDSGWDEDEDEEDSIRFYQQYVSVGFEEVLIWLRWSYHQSKCGGYVMYGKPGFDRLILRRFDPHSDRASFDEDEDEAEDEDEDVNLFSITVLRGSILIVIGRTFAFDTARDFRVYSNGFMLFENLLQSPGSSLSPPEPSPSLPVGLGFTFYEA
ncbi:hypothetical protein M422DRAFT_274982 [Sphaerobolus stellatus SS14]|uniref:Uncharacterized protein n=1 Tax=Sphaerobolus stellatus (strain SS14) TaxID=990650 RepID=A0A0C9TQU7_SPHS4|nr:hypothetical protein M422DRAFT_274982 [Sphaerobolus stellatus SS14]